MGNESPKPTTSLEDQRKQQKSVIDELEFIEDENEKFWKTPSSSRMVRGGTMMLTFDIIGSIFFTVYMMQLGRASTEDSSLLAVIDTLGIMLRFFAYLGFTGAGTKFMSEYMARDKDTARVYAKSAAKYNMWLTGFPLIGIALYLYLFKPSSEMESLAYLSLLIIIIFDRLTSNVTIYVLGSQRYDLYAYAYFIPFAGMYIGAMITYPIFGVAGPLISFAVARIVMFFLMVWMMQKCSDFPISDLFDWKADYGLFWKMFSFNFLYSVANLAFSLLTSTLLISFGELWDVLTAQEIVALYTISTFSNILMNLFGIVGPIMVSVSEASAVKNKKLVENYVMIALKFPIIMVIAVLTFFLLFGEEMITIFYGSRWVVSGMLIMACLQPAYAMGSFASKYDNILAGIGRPETVVVPWILALIIAVIGLIIGRFLPEVYLVDNIVEYQGEIENYGITLRFAFTLGITSIALFASGLWIVKICLKVLGVKIPGHYIWKPILVAIITALIVKSALWLFPIEETLNAVVLFGFEMGGILFTVVMVAIGVLIFITLGLFMDILNVEDGQFWKNVIGAGFLWKLMTPFLWYCKLILRHQMKIFTHKPLKWILTSSKEVMEQDQQFKIQIKPLTNNVIISEAGVELHRGQSVQFEIHIENVKVNLFNIISFARIDFTKVGGSLISFPDIDKSSENSFFIEFTVPETLYTGSHELQIVFEGYEQPRTDIDPEKQLKRGWWSYWDYRMRWTHEEEYFIHIQD